MYGKAISSLIFKREKHIRYEGFLSKKNFSDMKIVCFDNFLGIV